VVSVLVLATLGVLADGQKVLVELDAFVKISLSCKLACALPLKG